MLEKKGKIKSLSFLNETPTYKLCLYFFYTKHNLHTSQHWHHFTKAP